MRTTLTSIALLLAFTAVHVHAQASAPPNADVQIRAAVAALPAQFRDNAAVLGYRSATGPLEQIRAGDGAFICLADDPKEARFHVACYHRTLEPLMSRGRELRAKGVTGTAVDSVRSAEAASGTLKMPSHPAALYSLTAPTGSPDPATGLVEGARALHVIYVPFATAETTGLATAPSRTEPWLMNAGTFKAHIMFTPSM
jgi:hypothetical protein